MDITKLKTRKWYIDEKMVNNIISILESHLTYTVIYMLLDKCCEESKTLDNFCQIEEGKIYLISCDTHDIKDLKLIIGQCHLHRANIRCKILWSNHKHFEKDHALYLLVDSMVCPGRFKVHDADEYIMCVHGLSQDNKNIKELHHKPY